MARTPSPLDCVVSSSRMYSWCRSSQSPISAFCSLLQKHLWSSEYFAISLMSHSSSTALLRCCCAVGVRVMRLFSAKSNLQLWQPAATSLGKVVCMQVQHAEPSHQ